VLTVLERMADPQAGLSIHEGWLTKSPPLESQNLIFKARWRKRWVVLQQGSLSEQYSLLYYTDDSKNKLKGTINLNHCMNISSNLILEVEKKSQPYMFSLSTPDRVYHFSSDSKQLTQNWVEIISNACRRNIFFQGNETPKPKNTGGGSSKKSLKDPYIHLTECYSGEKKPPKIPPRPTKSSSDVKRQLSMNSFANDDIEYLDLEFPSNQENDVADEEKQEAHDKDIIYRNIDFIKTHAFIETRRHVEENKYNINKTNES